MIFIDSKNKNQILTFVPLIQDNYNEWHIVSLKFDTDTQEDAKELVEKFLESYGDVKGFCYLEGTTNAVSIMRLGEVESYSDVKNNIEKNIQDKRCKVLAKKVTPNGLKQIQLNLTSKKTGQKGSGLFEAREARENNVFLIADDDMFIRKSVCSLMKNTADTHEVDNGDQVLEKYKEVNPDIVVLDIHMPGKNGLDIVEELNELDSNAFVIISSSDAVKQNVLEAVKRGAIGFLAKPIQKEKLHEYLDQCITFTKEEDK